MAISGFLMIPLICMTVMLVAVVIAAIVLGNKILGAGSRGLSEDEVKTVQQIYRSLEKMEQRLDALEQILTDDRERHENE